MKLITVCLGCIKAAQMEKKQKTITQHSKFRKCKMSSEILNNLVYLQILTSKHFNIVAFSVFKEEIQMMMTINK